MEGSLNNLNTNATGLANTLFNFVNGNSKQINYTSMVSSSGVPYVVKAGSTIELTNDLVLDSSSSVTVEGNATLDFGSNSSSVYSIKKAASATGTTFTSKQGSILYITSPGGLSTDGATGNVQVDTYSYNQTAYFYYVGKARPGNRKWFNQLLRVVCYSENVR